jgi:hypothetical protein
MSIRRSQGKARPELPRSRDLTVGGAISGAPGCWVPLAAGWVSAG